jgi:type IV pilus assembly protein PilN
MINVLKNLFKKKNSTSDQESNNSTIAPTSSKKNKSSFFEKIKSKLGSKLGKSAVEGEEVIGVELTTKEIRLSQVNRNNDNSWVLEKFYLHKINLPEEATVLDNQDLIGNELQVALQKAKMTATNAAFAIPVTSAIIRVVTAPLMTDVELTKAVETDSLWENLIQLTDNLNDYSIFHQIIARHEKQNTMDILFVASKLSDINNYTSIIKKGGLNPVIIDVKCFAIKSSVDQINQLAGTIEESSLTAILEFGLDENYVMILNENNPIITDIFIRAQDRKTLKESTNQEEMESFVRRYVTQVKQAISDFESKYEKRIRSIKVISDLENVQDYLGNFRKSMMNTGFNLFDPLDRIQIPQQLSESIDKKNRSHLSTVIGLAFRKLDIFGYYKFVTAVKNINLLPDRNSMMAKKKMQIFSNFAFKGTVGLVGLIYILLFGLSFWNIQTYNSKLFEFDEVSAAHESLNKKFLAASKEFNVMDKTLKLSKSIKSNKTISYRVLAQIATSVPNRVQFNSINYDGKTKIIIEGSATSDQDILKLIGNLNTKSLINQASLATMTLPNSQDKRNKVRKGFKILVNIKNKS